MRAWKSKVSCNVWIKYWQSELLAFLWILQMKTSPRYVTQLPSMWSRYHAMLPPLPSPDLETSQVGLPPAAKRAKLANGHETASGSAGVSQGFSSKPKVTVTYVTSTETGLCVAIKECSTPEGFFKLPYKGPFGMKSSWKLQLMQLGTFEACLDSLIQQYHSSALRS